MGTSKPYSFIPLYISKFQTTKQLDLLVEGLLPSEMDNHAIYSKIFEDFLLFHLGVATTSKEKSHAWSQHKWKVTEAEKDKLSVEPIMSKFNTGKTQSVWHIKARSAIRNRWLNCNNGSMKCRLRNTGWREQWECVEVESKCQMHKPFHIQNSGIWTCKRSGYRAPNGSLKRLRKSHKIAFNKLCGDFCEEVAGWFARIQVRVWSGTCQQ